MKSWKSKGWGVYVYVEIPLTEDRLPKGIKSLNKDIKVGIGIQWIIIVCTTIHNTSDSHDTIFTPISSPLRDLIIFDSALTIDCLLYTYT